MQRITTANRVVDLHGPGKDGFGPGNPATNTPATFLSDDWCNQVQEELANSVEAAQLTPDGLSKSQLLEATRRIGSAKFTELDNGAHTLTLANCGLVVCDASAGSVTITLPAANVLEGARLRLLRIDASANTVTVSRAGTDVIYPAETSVQLTSQYDAVELVADGAGVWFRASTSGGVGLVGTIVWGTGVAPPPRAIKANGALLSRASYPALWAFAQTSLNLHTEATWAADFWGGYSTGDGSTTFRIPDLRGEFVRAWDDGRGVDGSRILGSFQNHSLQSHVHGYTGPANYAEDSPGGNDMFNPTTLNTTGPLGANVSNETRPRSLALIPWLFY